jgi:hypothetical protein
MGRHDAGGAWDRRADAELIRAVRRWHETHPVPPLPAEYLGPASALVQAEPALSPRERYTARRRLDEATE